MSEEWHPHEYQTFAVQHVLDHEECSLFLEMGLGKTVITLTAISEIMHERMEFEKCLVVAPKRVVENVWPAEIEKWDHLDYLQVSLVLGSQVQRVRALNTPADIYVISRDNLWWLARYYGEYFPFSFLVLDELSSFKSIKSNRFRALKRIRPYCDRVIGLTGTPAPNGLLDLFGQIYLLDMGQRLGNDFSEFRDQYFEPDHRMTATGESQSYTYRPKEGAENEIYRKIGDICLSMRSRDWLELKEPILRNVRVQLPAEAMEQYDQLENDMLLPLESADIVARTAAVLSGKLLQVANGAAYDESGEVQIVHSAKLEAMEDVIEAANGRPVLCYYAFKHDLQRLQKRFPDGLVLKTPEEFELWNRGEIPLGFLHPASGGHGLNLQGEANIIVWYSVPYSLELYLQANARLQRQGQKRQVIIHHLMAVGTLDEDVLLRIQEKTDVQNLLLEAVKARIDAKKAG